MIFFSKIYIYIYIYIMKDFLVKKKNNKSTDITSLFSDFF